MIGFAGKMARAEAIDVAPVGPDGKKFDPVHDSREKRSPGQCIQEIQDQKEIKVEKESMDHMDLEGREVTWALKGHRETVGLLEVLQALRDHKAHQDSEA